MTTKRQFGIKDLEKRFGVMTIGAFIRSFREADNISQGVFAKQLGLSQANLCDIEKGRKIPSPARAVKIAKKLGVSEKTLVQLSIQDALREAKLDYKVQLKIA